MWSDVSLRARWQFGGRYGSSAVVPRRREPKARMARERTQSARSREGLGRGEIGHRTTRSGRTARVIPRRCRPGFGAIEANPLADRNGFYSNALRFHLGPRTATNEPKPGEVRGGRSGRTAGARDGRRSRRWTGPGASRRGEFGANEPDRASAAGWLWQDAAEGEAGASLPVGSLRSTTATQGPRQLASLLPSNPITREGRLAPDRAIAASGRLDGSRQGLGERV